jgi:hypothetical protein
MKGSTDTCIDESLLEEESFQPTLEEKIQAEKSIKEFRTLVQYATKRGLNTKLLLHDPYLEDEEAANSLSEDLRTSFLEEEYKKLQSNEWFYVPPFSAANLHPPSSLAALDARETARNTLIEILGPKLGKTPETVGYSHIPRPLRLSRSIKANSQKAGGPIDIPLRSVTASRTTTRHYSTNLKFSNVARFSGENRVPGVLDSNQKMIKKQIRKKDDNKVVIRIDNTIDDGIEFDSDSECKDEKTYSNSSTRDIIYCESIEKANEKEQDNEIQDDSKRNDDEAIDAWWLDDCENENDDGISINSDDDWTDVILVVSAASDTNFDELSNQKIETQKLSKPSFLTSLNKKETSPTISTSEINPLDRSVFRKFVSPSLSFSKSPISGSIDNTQNKDFSSLSDDEWFRLCLVRATQKWQKSRKLMSMEAKAFSNNLAAALESVMKRVHGGIQFGRRIVKNTTASSKTQSRLHIRALLQKIYKARENGQKEPPSSLTPVSMIAGDSLRSSRSRSGTRHPTNWSNEAKSTKFSENARARSETRRKALENVQLKENIDNVFMKSETPQVHGSGKFSSGRDRKVTIKDKFFGIRQVIVPFTASVSIVTEAEIAKGSIAPGPGAHNIKPEHITRFGPHHRSSMPIIAKTSRRDKVSKSSLFRAMGERNEDELGVWEDSPHSAQEGDIIELDARLASQRPNLISAPHVGFKKALRVPNNFSETKAATVWGGDELVEVKSAQNLDILAKKIARAVRFIQQVEQEQKVAITTSERVNHALQASASQVPKSLVYLERRIEEGSRLEQVVPVNSSVSNSKIGNLQKFLDEILETMDTIEKPVTMSNRYFL